MLWLLHGYTVYAANGTFYLDASQWPFQCSDTGEPCSLHCPPHIWSKINL